jgi:hypothetical protein
MSIATSNNNGSRDQIRERIIQNRANNRGELGVANAIPDEYDISWYLSYLRNNLTDEDTGQKIIKKFDTSMAGFYFIILNNGSQDKLEARKLVVRNPETLTLEDSGSRIFIDVPHLFEQIKVENLNMEVLEKLQDFKNYFYYEGQINITHKLVAQKLTVFLPILQMWTF